jgi:outer membrane murein-binding lipoprotein Lpp
MKKNKIIITATIVSLLMLAGFYQVVNAQTTGHYSSIIQKLATKFNLKVEDVKAVFDEEEVTKEAEQQTRFITILDQAVTSNELTASQKDAILQKRAEMATVLETMTNLTPTERKEAMAKIQTEMKTWAEANGINLKYLFSFGGRKFGRGPGSHEGFGALGPKGSPSQITQTK